jgi:hypothetical protein
MQKVNAIMRKIVSRRSLPYLLDKACLKKIKMKALRAGVWFIVLPRIDRGLFDLTIKVASKIRSATLAKSITAIIIKLEDTLIGGVSRSLSVTGFSLARKLSILAQRWGNNSAKNWIYDLAFHRFLAIIHINDVRYSNLNINLNLQRK